MVTARAKARPAAPRFDGAGMTTPPADLAALRELLRKAAGPRPASETVEVVEVGTWAGRTALNFLDALPERRVVVYCVDHWRGTPSDRSGALAYLAGPDAVFRAFCKNAGRRLFDEVVPCRGRSLDWAAVWPKKADLVFLDGDHEYGAVVADLTAWMPHVRPGGVLALHDYSYMPGVTDAVDRMLPGRRRAGATVAYVEV